VTKQLESQARTALITGASSGLGAEFARQLASRGSNLVLVARSADKLHQLAAAIRQTAHVEVTVIPADLSSSQGVSHLIDEVRRQGLLIDLLVNNAGVGLFENFLDTPAQPQMEQIDLNVTALVRLTHAFVAPMVNDRRGGVINIASSAAFQPLPGANVYAASKAFVLFFSEALAFELADKDVHVLAACPGPVATAFFARMSPKMSAGEMDQPAAIVAQILRAFARRKRVVVPGKFSVRLGTWAERLMPRNTVLRLAAASVSALNRKTL